MGRLMVPVGGEMVVRELELPVGGLRLRGGVGVPRVCVIVQGRRVGCL